MAGRRRGGESGRQPRHQLAGLELGASGKITENLTFGLRTLDLGVVSSRAVTQIEGAFLDVLVSVGRNGRAGRGWSGEDQPGYSPRGPASPSHLTATPRRGPETWHQRCSLPAPAPGHTSFCSTLGTFVPPLAIQRPPQLRSQSHPKDFFIDLQPDFMEGPCSLGPLPTSLGRFQAL